MKIIHNNPSEKTNPLYFRKVSIGDVFLYKGVLYLKTNENSCFDLNENILLTWGIPPHRELTRVKSEISYTTL